MITFQKNHRKGITFQKYSVCSVYARLIPLIRILIIESSPDRRPCPTNKNKIKLPIISAHHLRFFSCRWFHWRSFIDYAPQNNLDYISPSKVQGNIERTTIRNQFHEYLGYRKKTTPILKNKITPKQDAYYETLRIPYKL